MSGLSDLQREMLNHEYMWWRFSASKDDPIHSHFQMSRTRYYALLDDLVWTEAALDYHPVVVGRLRELQRRPRRPEAVTQPMPAPRVLP